MLDGRIFKEYDIRGVVGRDIDRDAAVSIGKAFSCLLKKTNPEAKCVSIGRDVRLSSEDLASGIIEGIISSDLDVYDLGVCPTPLQYFQSSVLIWMEALWLQAVIIRRNIMDLN